MNVMEKPTVEFIDLSVAIHIATTSGPFVCTTEYCNLQGCPEDACSSFDW